MKKAIKKAVQKAKKIVKRLTSWSFSRFMDYEKCPYLCFLKHVEKRREPDNKATEHGTIVHKLAEQHTRGDLKKCPKELTKLKAGFVELRTAKAKVEQEWAFDKDWEPCGWFDMDVCVVRIKVDAHHVISEKKGKLTKHTVRIVDHKTGKEKPDHQLQRSLYAVGGFIMYPDADTVIAEHWYIETGAKRTSVYKRKELETLKVQWEQRTRAMLNDTRFAPRPSNACTWCFFRNANGGPCKF